MRSSSPIPRPPATNPGPSLESVRLNLADGAQTTLRVARFARSGYGVRVVAIEPRSTLLGWCARNRAEHAMIGGFYVRPGGPPLGDLRIGGARPPDPALRPALGRASRLRPRR